MNKSKRDKLIDAYEYKYYSAFREPEENEIPIPNYWQHFGKGYDAGYAEAQAQAKVLVEALVKIRIDTEYIYTDRLFVKKISTEALEQYRKAME